MNPLFEPGQYDVTDPEVALKLEGEVRKRLAKFEHQPIDTALISAVTRVLEQLQIELLQSRVHLYYRTPDASATSAVSVVEGDPTKLSVGYSRLGTSDLRMWPKVDYD